MKEAYFDSHTLDERAAGFLAAVRHLRDKRSQDLKIDTAALLVIDMQHYFWDPTGQAHIPSMPAILPQIQRLQQAFSERGRPVVQTRHLDDGGSRMARWWGKTIAPQSHASEIVEDISAPGVVVLAKNHYDAFYKTPLQNLLESRHIEQVVICGVMTHLCCETTARSAFMRGFDVFFGIDSTATYNRDFHLASLINLAHGFAVPLLTREIFAKMSTTNAKN